MRYPKIIVVNIYIYNRTAVSTHFNTSMIYSRYQWLSHQSSTVHEYTCLCVLGNSKNEGGKKKLIEPLKNISYEWTNLVPWVVKW